jgi:hypothetical protein
MEVKESIDTYPNKTVLLDRSDTLFKSFHVGLVIPRLDLEGDNRLGDGSRLVGGLLSLLLLVLGNSLSLDSLSLGILLLIIGTEKVDIIVILLGSGGSSLGSRGGRRRSTTEQVGGLGSISGQGRVLSLVRLDVSEPSGDSGVLEVGVGLY